MLRRLNILGHYIWLTETHSRSGALRLPIHFSSLTTPMDFLFVVGFGPRSEKVSIMLASNKLFRADVQVLRGVSVLAVILFHGFEQSFPNGYLGVDIFFVISGFIVTPLIWQAFAKYGESSTRQRFDAIKSF